MGEIKICRDIKFPVSSNFCINELSDIVLAWSTYFAMFENNNTTLYNRPAAIYFSKWWAISSSGYVRRYWK